MGYHVVFVDIVKYSERKSPTQRLVVESLFSLIKKVVQAQKLKQRVMCLPTGDGAAICIEQRPDLPTEALNFVSVLALSVQQWNDTELGEVPANVRTDFLSRWWSDGTRAFALRMGVTVGPHFRYKDYNNHDNLAGAAINQAARLLTLAGPNQVVFSQDAAELAKNAGDNDVRFLRTTARTVKERSYFGFQLIGPGGINPMPLEPLTQEKQRNDGLDVFPHLWIRTNHSSPEILWVPVDGDEWSRVTRTVIEHFGDFISTPYEIERPGHAAGSDVYRVADRDASKQPILLKEFRRLRADDELRQLVAIQEEIANAGIFEQYGQCLRLLPTSAGRRWVQSSHEGARQAMACHFLNEARTSIATHFKGESEQEIESVGEKFGRVNAVLMKSSLTPMYPVEFPLNPDRWDAVTNAVRNNNATSSRTIYVAHAEITLIERIREEINALSSTANYPITLNDFHPHNVFVSMGECVLIIDYEAVRNDWPEEATCAFALHRFCREYVRRIVGASNQPILDQVTIARSAAAAFLSGYGKARSEVINGVRTTGIRWAKAVNFAKLMGVIAYRAGLREDPKQRTEEQHFQEVIKFISYLKELDVFESALRR